MLDPSKTSNKVVKGKETKWQRKQRGKPWGTIKGFTRTTGTTRESKNKNKILLDKKRNKKSNLLKKEVQILFENYKY